MKIAARPRWRRRPRPRADCGRGAVRARRRRPRPQERRSRRRSNAHRAAGPRRRSGPRPHYAFFHCSQAIGMEESPVDRPAPGSPDNSIRPVLAAVGPAEGGRHCQRRQYRGDGGRRFVPAALSQERRPARHRRGHANRQRRVGDDRRGGQRQPESGTFVSVRRHGCHFRQTHPQVRSANHRPDERRSQEAKGTDLAKETHAAFPR